MLLRHRPALQTYLIVSLRLSLAIVCMILAATTPIKSQTLSADVERPAVRTRYRCAETVFAAVRGQSLAALPC